MSLTTYRVFLVVFTLTLSAAATAADDVVQRSVAALTSTRESEWRVAQAHLARAGTAALPELEAALARSNRATRGRVKETVNLLLLSSAAPDEIRQYPKLWNLAADEMKKASLPLAVLARQATYDTGELGLMPPEAVVRLSPERRAVNELVSLRGFAVPAALTLLANPEPSRRMYGVEILGRLHAFGQLNRLEEMLKDTGPIVASRGCYEESTTVGGETHRWLGAGELRRRHRKDGEQEKYAIAFEAEAYLAWLAEARGDYRSDIVNRLRQEARTLEASSWDDYWIRASPILRKAWD